MLRRAALILSLMLAVMLAGCTKDNTAPIVDASVPPERNVEFTDMFGVVGSENDENKKNAVAVYHNADIYVFVEASEMPKEGLSYTTKNGSKTIKLGEASPLDAAGLCMIKASEAGNGFAIPQSQTAAAGKTNVHYLNGEGNICNKENSDLSRVADISDMQIPAAVMSEGKCVGIVGSEGNIYMLKQELFGEANAGGGGNIVKIIVIIGIALVVLAALAVLVYKKKKSLDDTDAENYPANPLYPPSSLNGNAAPVGTVGSLHNIGMRPAQQDSMGVTETKFGLFAAVADGMGGLSESDKVSRKIIMTLLERVTLLNGLTSENALFEMTAEANKRINKMLGYGGGSGSTLVAILLGRSYFHWVSVGDSRIYLYHNRCLLQLNREHNYEMDLIEKAVNGETAFGEIKSNSRRHGLTSYIGMGRLAHVEGSTRPVKVASGDKLLLMSDGVYNTLSENDMIDILASAPDAKAAAAAFESKIISYNRPRQDNFTAIIVDIN